MEIAILLSPGVTAFEALGPFGVFRRVPDAEVHLVAERPGRVQAHGAKVALVADAAMDDHRHPDVIVVPGGLGIRRLVEDRRSVPWLVEAHATSRLTTAVSTGSVLLAAAGVLDGDATTHWLATELLEEQGAHAVHGNVVRSGKVLTSMGAPSAMEMSLQVVKELIGADLAQKIRDDLGIEELGPMDPRKPVERKTLVTLAGPDEIDPTPAYVLGGTAPTKKRKRPAKGRIEILFAPA